MTPSRLDLFQRALAETDAMRSIAEILRDLPDDDSRTRVLRWCHEHFPGIVRPASPRTLASGAEDRQRPAGPSGGHEPDPALTIDEDVFDAPRKRDAVSEDDEVDDGLPPERVHCEDADDLSDFAPARLVICDDEDLAVIAADYVTDEPEPVPQRAAPAVGLDSALRDFVADFQRLAVAFA